VVAGWMTEPVSVGPSAVDHSPGSAIGRHIPPGAGLGGVPTANKPLQGRILDRRHGLGGYTLATPREAQAFRRRRLYTHAILRHVQQGS
jgi:hypothetical protein